MKKKMCMGGILEYIFKGKVTGREVLGEGSDSIGTWAFGLRVWVTTEPLYKIRE